MAAWQPTALDADVAIVGLGGIGSATAFFAARRGLRVLGLERFELGGHAPRRLARPQPHHPAQLPHRALRPPDRRRRTTPGGRSSGASGEQCVWIDRRHRPVPAGRGHRRRHLHLGHGRGRRALRRCSTAPRCGAAGRHLGGRRRRGALPGRHRARLAGPGGAAAAAPGRGRGRRPARRVRGARAPAGDRVASSCVVDGLDRPLRAGCGRRWPPTRGPTTCSTGLDAHLPLTVLQEQVTLLRRCDDPAPFAMGRLPVWIWMDEPSFYGFPHVRPAGVKIAQDCGGGEVDRRRPRLRARSRPSSPAPTPSAGRSSAGGSARSPTPRPACTRSPRTGTSSSTACPATPRAGRAWARRTGSSSRPWFGRTLAALAAGADGRPTTSHPSPSTGRPSPSPPGRPSWLV